MNTYAKDCNAYQMKSPPGPVSIFDQILGNTVGNKEISVQNLPNMSKLAALLTVENLLNRKRLASCEGTGARNIHHSRQTGNSSIMRDNHRMIRFDLAKLQFTTNHHQQKLHPLLDQSCISKPLELKPRDSGEKITSLRLKELKDSTLPEHNNNLLKARRYENVESFDQADRVQYVAIRQEVVMVRHEQQINKPLFNSRETKEQNKRELMDIYSSKHHSERGEKGEKSSKVQRERKQRSDNENQKSVKLNEKLSDSQASPKVIMNNSTQLQFIQNKSQIQANQNMKPRSSRTVQKQPEKSDVKQDKATSTYRSQSDQKLTVREHHLQEKLQKFFTDIFRMQCKHKFISFPPYSFNHKYRAYVSSGNNGQIVKTLLQRRWWWKIIDKESMEQKVNLVWTQNKNLKYLDQLKNVFVENYELQKIHKDNESHIQLSNQYLQKWSEKAKNRKYLTLGQNSVVGCHNHFRGSDLIGNKKTFYFTMYEYFKTMGVDVNSYLPSTFIVSRDNFQDTLKQHIQSHPNDAWIVKPGENSNRGRGIKILKTFRQIEDHINSCKKSNRSFIIQRYLSDALLYKGRKFDIRCYIILTCFNGRFKGYWFQDGYIRTSCVPFKFEDFDNNFIHLTNDAVQKYSSEYGRHEPANKVSYSEFDQYLQQNYQISFFQNVHPKMEYLATQIIKASYEKIHVDREGMNFEIFGLDFMVDDKFQPWLIEVNTNPCLETPCALLTGLIPEMLENTFRLTLDLIFPIPCSLTIQRSLMVQEYEVKKMKLVFEEV